MPTIVRFAATNDPNGNPRCVFVVFEDGAISATYDEGFSGTAVLPPELRPYYQGVTFETTVAKYKDLVRDWAE